MRLKLGNSFDVIIYVEKKVEGHGCPTNGISNQAAAPLSVVSGFKMEFEEIVVEENLDLKALRKTQSHDRIVH